MKKLIHKINSWLYEYHRSKMFKYFHKMIGAKYYIRWSKKTKLSKAEKNYMKNDVNALYGMSCYVDTDSVR